MQSARHKYYSSHLSLSLISWGAIKYNTRSYKYDLAVWQYSLTFCSVTGLYDLAKVHFQPTQVDLARSPPTQCRLLILARDAMNRKSLCRSLVLTRVDVDLGIGTAKASQGRASSLSRCRWHDLSWVAYCARGGSENGWSWPCASTKREGGRRSSQSSGAGTRGGGGGYKEKGCTRSSGGIRCLPCLVFCLHSSAQVALQH